MLGSDVSAFNIRAKLTTLALPILCLFSLSALVSTNGIGSNCLILALVWVLLSDSELRNRWWRLLWPWLLVVLVYFLAMSTYAFSRVTALRDGGEVLKGISLSVVALYLIRLPDYSLRKTIEYVVIFLTITATAITMYNLHLHDAMSFTGNGFDWYVNRNRLGVGFSIASVFITALMVNEPSRLKSYLLSVAWILLAGIAILNGSRGALIGMVFATIFIILAALCHLGWMRVFRLDLWLIPIWATISIGCWIGSKQISFHKYLIHQDQQGVDTGRFGIWQAVSERIVQRPWFGYGPHAMKYDHMIEPSRVLYQDHPHSIYVGLVYASGIFGIIFWLIWFSSFSYRIRQNFLAKNEVSYYLGIGLLINILVHGLVDFDFYMFSVFTYIIVGLVMILPKFSNQARS